MVFKAAIRSPTSSLLKLSMLWLRSPVATRVGKTDRPRKAAADAERDPGRGDHRDEKREPDDDDHHRLGLRARRQPRSRRDPFPS